MQPQLAVVAHHLASNMDFQFTHHVGAVIAKCSMGHEAVANWLNSEVRSDSQVIFTALSYLKQAQKAGLGTEFKLIGNEYSLFINSDEVIVRANNLDIESHDEPDDDFHYYDEESVAFCGLEDFTHFLESYLKFSQE